MEPQFTTLEYILDKYDVKADDKSPIVLKISRWNDLPQLLVELGFRVGAEIGVLAGSYTVALLKAGLQIYAIDPWLQFDKKLEYYDYRKKDMSEYEKAARERVEGQDVKIIKATSMDALKEFKDDSLDFVFIDGNHEYRHVVDDIDEWSRKVRKGGIVMGHDYFKTKGGRNQMQVVQAVNGWVSSKKISPLFITKGVDKCPCWFYVRT